MFVVKLFFCFSLLFCLFACSGCSTLDNCDYGFDSYIHHEVDNGK